MGCGCCKTAFEACADPQPEGLTSRRLQGRAGPRPVPPAFLAGAGTVCPGQPAQGAPLPGARRRPEALAVTRWGPAPPPPPPGKNPLTPLPPSSPPSCRSSNTTEFGAAGLAGPAFCFRLPLKARARGRADRPEGQGVGPRPCEAGLSVPLSL